MSLIGMSCCNKITTPVRLTLIAFNPKIQKSVRLTENRQLLAIRPLAYSYLFGSNGLRLNLT